MQFFATARSFKSAFQEAFQNQDTNANFYKVTHRYNRLVEVYKSNREAMESDGYAKIETSKLKQHTIMFLSTKTMEF